MQQPDHLIDYSEHALDILTQALVHAERGERFALVASLRIEGGSARAIGSLAIVSEQGQMTGYLSNGCIDRDIIFQCLNALEEHKVKLVRYGAGSQYMDIRLPCGGALEIVIDPQPDIELLRETHAALVQRQTASLYFSTENGLVSSTAKLDAKLFVYSPKPRLFLVGRGAILRKAAELALQLDFDLRIATPDDDDLHMLSALVAEPVHRMRHPNQDFDIEVDAHTAVMLMFHDHEWEQSVLMSCARKAPFFIGAMGSRKTHEMRIAGLLENGLPEDLCAGIRGPIGLVPSLRNASLIAVSALAEVVDALPQSQTEVPID